MAPKMCLHARHSLIIHVGISSFTFKLEELGLRKVWASEIGERIYERLRKPRFGFPGVFDRSPPPPKTLHWKHAPAAGEYQKIRAMLCWAVLHLGLIQRRLGADTRFNFVIEHCMSNLENELIMTWLPDASIPAFSLKGEGKKLMEDFSGVLQEVVESESTDGIVKTAWKNGLMDLGIAESDSRIGRLRQYIMSQEEMLRNLSIEDILESSKSWTWIDSLEP
jgi:hypothetical protein